MLREPPVTAYFSPLDFARLYILNSGKIGSYYSFVESPSFLPCVIFSITGLRVCFPPWYSVETGREKSRAKLRQVQQVVFGPVLILPVISLCRLWAMGFLSIPKLPSKRDLNRGVIQTFPLKPRRSPLLRLREPWFWPWQHSWEHTQNILP